MVHVQVKLKVTFRKIINHGNIGQFRMSGCVLEVLHIYKILYCRIRSCLSVCYMVIKQVIQRQVCSRRAYSFSYLICARLLLLKNTLQTET